MVFEHKIAANSVTRRTSWQHAPSPNFTVKVYNIPGVEETNADKLESNREEMNKAFVATEKQVILAVVESQNGRIRHEDIATLNRVQAEPTDELPRRPPPAARPSPRKATRNRMCPHETKRTGGAAHKTKRTRRGPPPAAGGGPAGTKQEPAPPGQTRKHCIAVRHRKKSQAPGPLHPSEVKHFLRRSGIRRCQASSLRANATKLLDEVMHDITRCCVAYADSQNRKKIVLADINRSYNLVEGSCMAGIEDAFDRGAPAHQEKGGRPRKRAAASHTGAGRPKRKSQKTA
eukprot:g14744.t1